jgi:phosphohistidine phosphatase
MRIYIIRHGQANNNSPTGRDGDRTLTDLGHRHAQAIGAFLKEQAEPPTLILASPITRAQQTAGHIWDAMDFNNAEDRKTEDRLSTSHCVSDTIDLITEHKDLSSIALIGHNPTCAAAVSTLTQGLGAYEGVHHTGEVFVLETDTPDDLVGQCKVIGQYRLEE